MAIVNIMLVLILGTVLCIVEIPKLKREHSIKELLIFLSLLALGITMAILRSLDIDLPVPSDWISWVYSPIAKLLEEFFK